MSGGWTPEMPTRAHRATEDALFKSQVTILELVDEVNRRGDLIRRLTRKRGPMFDNALRTDVANANAADARRYHREQGLTLRQTALRMGTSVQQVCRWLRRPHTKD